MMKPDPNVHRRQSIRLRGYDYSQAGAYFVTVCTQNRECLFGEIAGGEMRLNDKGRIVGDEWTKTTEIRKEIELDEWVVMPNHFHAVVIITGSGVASPGRGDRPVAPTGPQPRSIGAIMAGFKSAVTKRINEWRRTPGKKLWQRNYWEHVIRNESDLNQTREYIQNNATRWEQDKLHPDNPAWQGRPAGRPYGQGAPFPRGSKEGMA